jgi:hypothetical protein
MQTMLFITHINIPALSYLFNQNAYLDPGSGSFIIQLLLAALLGSLFLIKAYWQKIKSLFHKKISHEDQDSEE